MILKTELASRSQLDKRFQMLTEEKRSSGILYPAKAFSGVIMFPGNLEETF